MAKQRDPARVCTGHGANERAGEGARPPGGSADRDTREAGDSAALSPAEEAQEQERRDLASGRENPS